MKDIVWEFTNQKTLTKKEYMDYFERKVFRTLRKYGMLPKNKLIKLKKSLSLNTKVLKDVIEKKFEVKTVSKNETFSSENMSDVAEGVFKNILNGKFVGPKPKDRLSRPLYFLNDKEIELYAKLKKIKGKKSKREKKIQGLFERFKKNPDLEHNIVNALLQLY